MLITWLKSFLGLIQVASPSVPVFRKSPLNRDLLLERMIRENPRFHFWDGELINSWSIQTDTLRYLYSLLKPGMITLETGCGQSTMVFAIAGTRHTSIMPDIEEAKRVRKYCRSLELNPSLSFLIGSSDAVLPCQRRIPPSLDFVFIDGAHAFPAPIIDWHYTAVKLKIGGIMAVDDCKMPSVKLLVDLLCLEDEWEVIDYFQNTAFFRKLAEPKHLIDWAGQKMNKDFLGY